MRKKNENCDDRFLLQFDGVHYHTADYENIGILGGKDERIWNLLHYCNFGNRNCTDYRCMETRLEG